MKNGLALGAFYVSDALLLTKFTIFDLFETFRIFYSDVVNKSSISTKSTPAKSA